MWVLETEKKGGRGRGSKRHAEARMDSQRSGEPGMRETTEKQRTGETQDERVWRRGSPWGQRGAREQRRWEDGPTDAKALRPQVTERQETEPKHNRGEAQIERGVGGQRWALENRETGVWGEQQRKMERLRVR